MGCRSFAGPGRRRVFSFWALTAPGVSGAVIFPFIGEQLNPNSGQPEMPLQQKDQQEQ
jgi:hypothetical protein